MDLLWYFAYGSNMHPAIFVDRRRMQPHASHGASLEDYRLCFNIPVGAGERGVANLEASPGERLFGVLYQLSPADCERLDRSEGVPMLYRRLAVRVTTIGGRQTAAFTYVSTVTAPGRKPSARYLNLLLGGARHHGLPDVYVKALEALELAVDERLDPQP